MLSAPFEVRMPTTVLYEDEPIDVAAASVRGGDLWLSADDLARATGWELKAQGFCRGERCVPVPPGARDEFLAPDGHVNLSAFARSIGQPGASDEAHGVWAFPRRAAAPAPAYGALAPEFSLPDLDGTLHRLSDYRGSKVLLLSWASW